MYALLIKATTFKHTAGFALYGNPPRWHKLGPKKHAPKGAPVAASPQAAGHFEPTKHFSDSEWERLHLHPENTNAETHKNKLAQIKHMAESGDVTGLLGMPLGSNLYGKKLAAIINHLLGLYGSPHKVMAGQKAGEHPAVKSPGAQLTDEPAKPAGDVTWLANGAAVVKHDGNLYLFNKNEIKDYLASGASVFSKIPPAYLEKMLVDPSSVGSDGFTPAPQKTQDLHQITSPELLADYTNYGFNGVNSTLRKFITPTSPLFGALETAFASQKLSTSPEVWRGIDTKLDVKPGQVLFEPGFMSTSLDKQTAESFGKGGTVFKIKNAEGLYISGSESELLINRGAKLRVVSSEDHEDYRLVTAEIDVPSPAAKPPAAGQAVDTGPKDGDTKPAADGGTLVLKDGHWIKQSGPFTATLYHGTSHDFDEYDDAHAGKTTDSGFYGVGMSMSPNKAMAEQYAKFSASETGQPGKVITKHVHLQKPLYTKTGAMNFVAAFKEATGKTPGTPKEVTADLKAAGFDGVVVQKDDGSVSEVTVFSKPGKPNAHSAPAAPAPTKNASSKLSRIPWDKMLTTSEKNAGHNAQVAKIKAMAHSGDTAGLEDYIAKKGTPKQTYAKKQKLLAQTALAALKEEGAPAPVIPPASQAHALTSPVTVERYGAAGAKGAISAGVFFAPKGQATSEYGKELHSFEIPAGSMLFNGKSSIAFAQQHGLMDLEDPDVKKITGLSSLSDVLDQQGVMPPQTFHNAFQTVAKRELEKAGYQGAYWSDEDDLNPEQYQIWGVAGAADGPAASTPASPPAAGASPDIGDLTAEQLGKLQSIPWFKQKLGPEKSNAKSHNIAVDKIEAMAFAGDKAGLQAFIAGKAGAKQYYANKQAVLAQAALAVLQEGEAAAPTPEAKPPANPLAKPKRVMLAKKPASPAPAIAPVTAAAPKGAENMKAPKVPAGAPQPPKVTHHWDDIIGSLKNWAATGDLKNLKFYADPKNGWVLNGPGGAAVREYAADLLAYVESSAAQPAPAQQKKKIIAAIPAEKVPDGPPQPPKVSDKWTGTIDFLTKWATEGKFDLLAEYADPNAWPKPTTADAAAAKKYAADLLAYNASSAAQPAAAADTGPKEGDIKQGADGLLVLKNGHWVRLTKKEKAAALSAWQTAIHKGQVPKKADAMVAESVNQENPERFLDLMYEALPYSLEADDPNFGSHLDRITEKATIAHLLALRTPDRPKAPGPKPVKPTDAPIAMVPGVESIDHWVQTGPQGGSNPGGRFKDADGVEWYCKFPQSEDIAKSEVLAANLYALAGVTGQDAKLISKGGKLGIASRWVDVKKASSPAALSAVDGVKSGFAVDAWLGNWDVVGLGLDNLQIGADGKAVRVDAGGSLEYRAQGGKKAFGNVVTEIESLRDPKMNPQAAAVFGDMTTADITASVKKVVAIADDDIYDMVMQHGPGTHEQRAKLIETLIERKKDLLDKFPKAVKKAKEKPKPDPTALKVDASQLPKPHDFKNWNGPGHGLSSQAHVNEMNAKAEQDLFDFAMKGNLVALKDYHYDAVDKSTGKPLGKKPIDEHPSKHVKEYWSGLVSALNYIAYPPEALEGIKTIVATSVKKVSDFFKAAKYGMTTNKADASARLAFWIALGRAKSAEKLLPPGKTTAFQSEPKDKPVMTQEMVSAAINAYSELSSSRLVKTFINKIQKSGSYNDNFRDGKMVTSDGHDAVAMVLDAYSYATEKPEGFEIYKWINLSPQMREQLLKAAEGTVFQNPGSMCCSYDPNSTAGFGSDRMRIRYAKGAKAVDTFGSKAGQTGFKKEYEITTLPGQRFVILSCKKVMCPVQGEERIELDVLMLPPDPTYISELEAMKGTHGKVTA